MAGGSARTACSADRLVPVESTDQPAPELTARQRDMFEFERTWWSFDEPRDQLIRARFGCSPDEYYAELNRLLDSPAAMAHDPLVVRRFQRRRARRHRELRRDLESSSAARRAVDGQTS